MLSFAILKTRIPKDITGNDLIKLLKPFGYTIIRQSGSHIRIQTNINGEHSLTVPNHNPIKIGTLNSILKDIANHLKVTKEELILKLF